MQELKPCPFCGHGAACERVGTNRQSCIVICTDCGCSLESGETGDDCGTKWNTRADDKEVSKLKEQLAIAVDFIEKVYSDESDIAAAIQIPTGLVLRALQALTKIKDMECQKD